MATYQALMQSRFLQQVFALGSGTAISQAIALGLLPVLTRLYSPEDFGILTLYISVASLLYIFGSMRYEAMVMLPHSNRAAAQLVQLVFFISVVAAIMIFLVVLFFRHRIAAMLGNPDVAPWLFFLPVSLFFVANYQALRYWVMRLQNFSTVSQGMVVKVSSNYLSAIMIKLGAVPLPAGGGLVMGAILADIANAAWLFFGCRKRDRVLFEKMRPRRLAGMAQRHGPMAATLTVSHGVGVLNMRIPGLVISSFFGPAALGFFGVAERLASAPSQLVSGAIGDVYRQRASVLYRETGRFDRLMVKTLLMTFVLAIVPYAIGIAFAPDIFRILLGPQWEEAGRYASIIMVGGFFSFVTTPVDKAAIITGAKGIILFVHFMRLFLLVLSSVLVWFLGLGLPGFIMLVVGVNIIFYGVVTIKHLQLAKGRGKK